MNLVFITPECVPYTSATGLGDLVYMLARNIERQGHNVKVIIPRYGSIDPIDFQIERLPHEIHLNFNGVKTQAITYKGILNNSLVSVFLTDNQTHFSNSKEVYVSEKIDLERFDYFCNAALAVISKLDFRPDVIHMFNPYTAFCAHLLKSTEYSFSDYTQLAFTIYDIENIGYPIQEIGKKAISYSSFTATTSESYKNEILNGEIKTNLQNTLLENKNKFISIFSTIDEELYNPEEDNIIPQKYSSSYFSVGKKKCKEDLVSAFQLQDDFTLPIFSLFTNLIKYENIEFLLHALHHILSLDLQLVVIGRGESKYAQELLNASQKNKNFKYISSCDSVSLKKIYSGSDFVLSIGNGELNAQNILKGMRYGAIPIVNMKSIFKEIIVDEEENCNGIPFSLSSKEDLLKAIYKGLELYKNKQTWTKVVKQAMNFDLNNEEAAKKYINCYENILQKA